MQNQKQKILFHPPNPELRLGVAVCCQVPSVPSSSTTKGPCRLREVYPPSHRQKAVERASVPISSRPSGPVRPVRPARPAWPLCSVHHCAPSWPQPSTSFWLPFLQVPLPGLLTGLLTGPLTRPLRFHQTRALAARALNVSERLDRSGLKARRCGTRALPASL